MTKITKTTPRTLTAFCSLRIADDFGRIGPVLGVGVRRRRLLRIEPLAASEKFDDVEDCWGAVESEIAIGGDIKEE